MNSSRQKGAAAVSDGKSVRVRSDSSPGADLVMRTLFLIGALLVFTLVAPFSAIARGSASDGKHWSARNLAARSKKSSGINPKRTERVRGYTKKNGTKVAPYKRAPRGSGNSKKKRR